MKKINIYLTNEERNKATEIMRKYKVSLSTLTSVICWHTYKAVGRHDKDKLEELQLEYVGNKNGNKTSVKPECYKDEKGLFFNLIKEKSKFSTNALRIYLNRQIAKYTNKEGLNDYWNGIDKELTEKKEIFWNYNNLVRSTARAVRENKEYYKRILEQE